MFETREAQHSQKSPLNETIKKFSCVSTACKTCLLQTPRTSIRMYFDIPISQISFPLDTSLHVAILLFCLLLYSFVFFFSRHYSFPPLDTHAQNWIRAESPRRHRRFLQKSPPTRKGIETRFLINLSAYFAVSTFYFRFRSRDGNSDTWRLSLCLIHNSKWEEGKLWKLREMVRQTSDHTELMKCLTINTRITGVDFILLTDDDYLSFSEKWICGFLRSLFSSSPKGFCEK